MIKIITDQIKQALKNKEKERLILLRSLKTALRNREIECGSLDEKESISVLKKQIKSRQQAAEMYEKGGRPELAENERNEVEIIKEFMPEQLTAEELEKEADLAIAKLDAATMRDMGKVMKYLKDKIGNRFDGKVLSRIVKTKLSI